MSNKFRYYDVNIIATVKANNKGEALALVLGDDFDGEILDERFYVDRVTAVEARNHVAWNQANL